MQTANHFQNNFYRKLLSKTEIDLKFVPKVYNLTLRYELSMLLLLCK